MYLRVCSNDNAREHPTRNRHPYYTFLENFRVGQRFKKIPTLNEIRRTRIVQSFIQSVTGLWTIEELLPHSVASRLNLLRTQLPKLWYRGIVELRLSEGKVSN